MRRAGPLLSAQMPLSCGGRERLGGAACVAGGSGRVRGRRVRARGTCLLRVGLQQNVRPSWLVCYKPLALVWPRSFKDLSSVPSSAGA